MREDDVGAAAAVRRGLDLAVAHRAGAGAPPDEQPASVASIAARHAAPEVNAASSRSCRPGPRTSGCTTLRFTFSVGVSSPVSWERSRVEDLEALDLLAPARRAALTSSMAFWTASRTSLVLRQLGQAARLDAARRELTGASSAATVTSATR